MYVSDLDAPIALSEYSILFNLYILYKSAPWMSECIIVRAPVHWYGGLGDWDGQIYIFVKE